MGWVVPHSTEIPVKGWGGGTCLNLSTWDAERQADFGEFEASLVYTAISRTAWSKSETLSQKNTVKIKRTAGNTCVAYAKPSTSINKWAKKERKRERKQSI